MEDKTKKIAEPVQVTQIYYQTDFSKSSSKITATTKHPKHPNVLVSLSHTPPLA